MSAAFREQVKDTVAAFTVFVEETLSKEKLSGKAEEEKNKLKKLLENLKEEYPALKSISDHAKESHASTGSIPNLYDAAAKSQAVPGSELLSQAKISGYLKKRSDGLITSKPKKKWCGIREDTFYIYDKPNDKKQKGQIDLPGALVRKFEGGKKYPFGLEVVCPTTGSHVFFAGNDQELKSWLTALGVKEERPPPSPIEDDGEMYEEFDHPSLTPQPQPVVPADNDDDIYEEDFAPGPVQPRAQSEIYEDTADPVQPQDEPEETYDDVQVEAVKPPPTRKTESKPISAPKKPLPQPPGINYENLFYALWSRTGDQPDELSFCQADILLVRNKVFDKFSWWAAEINGKVGYVPKNFLTPVYIPVK